MRFWSVPTFGFASGMGCLFAFSLSIFGVQVQPGGVGVGGDGVCVYVGELGFCFEDGLLLTF